MQLIMMMLFRFMAMTLSGLHMSAKRVVAPLDQDQACAALVFTARTPLDHIITTL